MTWNWGVLKQLLGESTALGVAFRVVGAEVEVGGLEALPATLRDPIEEARCSGFLWTYLGADLPDEEATSFLAKWNVEPILITDRGKVGACVTELLEDLAGDTNPDAAVGIDVETAPAGWRPPPVKLKNDGGVHAAQPASDKVGLDPHTAQIQTVQLYAGGERAFVFKGPALLEVLDRLASFKRLVAHNAVFEETFLRQCTGSFWSIECTLQAAGLLYGVHSRGINDVSGATFGIVPPKDLQTSCWSAPRLSTGQISYAAADAVLAYHLWPRLNVELERQGRSKVYALQTAVIPSVVDMQLRGLGIDREEHRRQSEAWARELAALRRQYHDITGSAPPSTPRELQQWIAAVVPEQVASGKWPLTDRKSELSTRAKRLKRLIHTDNPTVKPVLRALSLETLIAGFGPKLLDHVNPVTGRVHASYNISGSKAGRFTCSSPNMQQLPNRRAPEFRKCVVPSPGYLLVCCDWSQVELRAAAWLSGDPVLTQAFEDGLDLHRLAAAATTGLPYDMINEEQRKGAKPVNFGWLYGISAKALAENAFADYDIDMSEQQAQRALDSYGQKYCVLDEWRRRQVSTCLPRGRIDIGCGRVLRAAWEIEQNGHLTKNQCYNIPVQGICADLLLRAMILVRERLAEFNLDAVMVNCSHDEILVEASEKGAEQARRILEECMIEAFVATFPGAPLRGVATAAIGTTWFDAKPK
jgi:DNA polymerase I